MTDLIRGFTLAQAAEQRAAQLKPPKAPEPYRALRCCHEARRIADAFRTDGWRDGYCSVCESFVPLAAQMSRWPDPPWVERRRVILQRLRYAWDIPATRMVMHFWLDDHGKSRRWQVVTHMRIGELEQLAARINLRVPGGTHAE